MRPAHKYESDSDGWDLHPKDRLLEAASLGAEPNVLSLETRKVKNLSDPVVTMLGARTT